MKRFGCCLDGAETIASLINRRFKIPVGQTDLIFNVVIYSIAGILFGLARAMYSLLTYFIASKVLDIVESEPEQAKAALIITNDASQIAEAIYKNLGRTVTLMEGEGLVTGKKVILYCVITRLEVKELRTISNEKRCTLIFRTSLCSCSFHHQLSDFAVLFLTPKIEIMNNTSAPTAIQRNDTFMPCIRALSP